MSNPMVEKLQEMSVTIETLSAQFEELKKGTRSSDNAEKVESISCALDQIKESVAAYQPYMEG